MSIGAVHRDCYRNPVRLGQQAALDTAFAAIRRIGAGFFSLPTVPSSSRHPSTTMPNQSHRVHRVPTSPSARTPRTPRPGPLLEPPMRRTARANAGGTQGITLTACTQYKQNRFHRRAVAHPWVMPPTDAAYEAARAATFAPKSHLATASHRPFLASP